MEAAEAAEAALKSNTASHSSKATLLTILKEDLDHASLSFSLRQLIKDKKNALPSLFKNLPFASIASSLLQLGRRKRSVGTAAPSFVGDMDTDGMTGGRSGGAEAEATVTALKSTAPLCFTTAATPLLTIAAIPFSLRQHSPTCYNSNLTPCSPH